MASECSSFCKNKEPTCVVCDDIICGYCVRNVISCMTNAGFITYLKCGCGESHDYCVAKHTCNSDDDEASIFGLITCARGKP